jgi:hypothetical protein
MYDRYIKESDARYAIMDYIGEQTVSKYASSAECKAARYGAEGAMYAIEDVPTADVVKVVRCKDCKYFTKEMIADSLECICKSIQGMVDPSPDFYCSYGERKEGE